MSESLQPHGPYPVRLFCPGVGCHVLLQGIFPTQGSNPCLLHCRQILYLLSHQGSPISIHSKAININPENTVKKMSNVSIVWQSCNYYSIQFSSGTQSCLTLCNPMNRSTPGLPVYHQLLESTQTHVHWVSDSIQPSHLLLSPSPPALNLSQLRGSFQISQLSASGGQSIGVSASTSVLQMNTQDWSPLVWTGWISLQSKGLSRVFSNTTVQKHQFFGAQLSL